MKTLLMSLTLAVAVLASSCGGGLGSCTTNQGNGTGCVEYESLPFGMNAEAIQTACTQGQGTYASGACSATNRVGRCRMTTTFANVSSKQVQSFYAPTTAAEAELVCTGLGTSSSFTTSEWLP